MQAHGASAMQLLSNLLAHSVYYIGTLCILYDAISSIINGTLYIIWFKNADCQIEIKWYGVMNEQVIYTAQCPSTPPQLKVEWR